MASKNLKLALAEELLNGKNLPFTASMVKTYVENAVADKRQDDIRRIGRLLDQLDTIRNAE